MRAIHLFWAVIIGGCSAPYPSFHSPAPYSSPLSVQATTCAGTYQFDPPEECLSKAARVCGEWRKVVQLKAEPPFAEANYWWLLFKCEK